MFTTSAAMLVLLGFLVATLLTFLFAPAYRSRISRLTEQGLRRSMPMTEAEIRADKDRLRADYAIKLHKQALTLDELRSATARHVIEINRRDARITALEGDLDGIKSRLEESDTRSHFALVRVAQLSGGFRLLVGRDLEERRRLFGIVAKGAGAFVA